MEKSGKPEAIVRLALTKGNTTFPRERLGILMGVKPGRMKPSKPFEKKLEATIDSF